MPSPSFSAIGSLTNIAGTTSVSRPAVSTNDVMLLFAVVGYSNSSPDTPARKRENPHNSNWSDL